MIRVKITKRFQSYLVGDIVVLDRKRAFDLIEKGLAIISKDMTPDDYKQAGDKNGITTQLRTD